MDDELSVPVTHSIPEAEGLAEVVAKGYSFNSVSGVRFHRRGLSDVYTAVCDSAPYVVRVYRHGWRSDSDVRWEAELLRHLTACGVPVTTVVPSADGDAFLPLAAPEGRRQLMLLTFAEGRQLREGHSKGSMISVSEHAEDYGALAARIHAAADTFRTPHHRFALDLDHLLRRPLRAADPLLADRPGDRRWLRETVEFLAAEIDMLSSDLDWGPCHGDLTGGNAVVADGLVMFDFDSGGPGWRLYDLGVFAWSTALQRRPESDLDRFLAGYQAVRPLPTPNREAVTLFSAIREVWFIGLQTENAPDWGYGLADDDFLTRRLELLRSLVEPLRR
ncbi:phosphotransferase enzyme family protein [Spirillospora sp. CA-255316]